MQEKIICPVCNKEVLNLLGHIKKHNPKIRSKKVFYEYFPNYEGKFQIDCSKKITVKCPYCNKEFNKNNALQIHIKKIHPEFFIKQEIVKKCANLICPICNHKVSDMKQHIKRHEIYNWDDFCFRYNWDVKLVKSITEDYRNNLSKNKKDFYNSERGLLLREEQSIKMQTDAKRICWASVKEKSMNTRAKNKTLSNSGPRGLHVITNYGSFRSYNEFIFATLCKLNNINLEYENLEYSIKWYNLEKGFIGTYVPDFYHYNTGLIELKAFKKDVKEAKKEEKYIQAEKIYKKLNIPFYIFSLDEALSMFGLKYSYKEKILIKKYVLDLVSNNEIQFICPYKKSKILYELFETEDYSTLDFIKIKQK